MPMTWKDLKQVSFFRDLSPKAFDEIITFLTPFVEFRTAVRGESLSTPDQIVTHLVLVLNGVARSVQYTNSGIELFSYYFTKGQPVFLLSCITGTKSTSYYIADRRSYLAYIPRNRFLESLDMNSEFKDSLLKYICVTSEALIRHVYTIQMKKAKHRVCDHLVSMCKETESIYEIPFNMEKLARYLNLARPTLSKELHLLQEEGTIEIKKNNILISDLDMLYQSLNE
jgi:CRP-like cAMP-binding protein